MANVVKYKIVGDTNIQGGLLFDAIDPANVPNAPSGKFALFNDSTNSNKLSTKDSAGTVVEVGGGSQAMYIESNIPNNNSELALHFELQIYSDATYDTSVETFNSSSSQANIQLFDGTDWVAMPAGGAVKAYYGNKIRFALQTAVAGTNYYTRIRTLYNSTGSTWVALSDWFASTYPNYSMIIPELPAVAIKALTGGSNTPASHLHKHPAVEYDEGAESGAVSLDFARGDYQQIATVAATPVTSMTMINSIAGDVLEIEVDNANATTVTPKATELIGAGETGKYIITLRNIGGTIMVDKTKTEIE